MNQEQARYWVFTHNNYTEEEYGALHGCAEKDPEVIKYICGREVGENGTPHMQGCIGFKRPKRFKWVKRWLGQILWEPHVERARNPQVRCRLCTHMVKGTEEAYNMWKRSKGNYMNLNTEDLEKCYHIMIDVSHVPGAHKKLTH